MGTMPWRQVSAERKEKKGLDEPPAYRHGVDEVSVPEKISTDNTHRNLKPRHIQLIGIGGTIGTALFVQIGRGLLSGGPASLFLAFSWWYVSPALYTYPLHPYMPLDNTIPTVGWQDAFPVSCLLCLLRNSIPIQRHRKRYGDRYCLSLCAGCDSSNGAPGMIAIFSGG